MQPQITLQTGIPYTYPLFLPVKDYQPMFDRKRGSLCYPTTPKHLPEPCAPTPHLSLFHTALGSPFPRHGTHQAPYSPHSAWDACAILFLRRTHRRDAIPQAATRNTFLSCGGEPLRSSSGHCQSHQVPALWQVRKLWQRQDRPLPSAAHEEGKGRDESREGKRERRNHSNSALGGDECSPGTNGSAERMRKKVTVSRAVREGQWGDQLTWRAGRSQPCGKRQAGLS